MGSLFKLTLARGSDPYMPLFSNIHLARGSSSFLGSLFKVTLARGSDVVLGCHRLGYVGLFEVKLGRVALCCFKVGGAGLYKNEARAW